MELYTLQLGRHRVASSQNIPLLNITAKSGDDRFAPSWDMVMALKENRINQMQFSDMYYEKMRQSYNADPNGWIQFLTSHDKLAIACMCAKDAFCHRHLLVGIFAKICHFYQIPFTFKGELELCDA